MRQRAHQGNLILNTLTVGFPCQCIVLFHIDPPYLFPPLYSSSIFTLLQLYLRSGSSSVPFWSTPVASSPTFHQLCIASPSPSHNSMISFNVSFLHKSNPPLSVLFWVRHSVYTRCYCSCSSNTYIFQDILLCSVKNFLFVV